MKKLLFHLSILFFTITQSIVSQEIIYNTDTLKIKKLKTNVFQHISFMQTNDFGKVAANGMVYFSKNEAIVFDTPVNNEASKELIHWIQEKNNKKIMVVVATHFHDDCLAGIETFHNNNISSYASKLTIELAKKDGKTPPIKSFKSKKKFKVGNTKVLVKHFGEGHTKDNIVGYISNQETLFGGCLVKCLGANEGYLGDANVSEWSETIAKIKEAFPNLELIIPGHGNSGDTALLDYTIKLFKQN